jgi:hypothetical protein
MTIRHLILLSLPGGVVLLGACHKSTNSKPIYDTVTVTKTDTVPPVAPNLTNGLVLYLPFANSSMNDLSGGNNAVTAAGGGGLGYDMHGYANSAYAGNGSGSYLAISNNGFYTLDTAFSISMDFMIRSVPYNGGTGSPGLMSLVSLVDPATGYGPSFHIGMTVPGMPLVLDVGINPSSNTCDNAGSANAANENDTTTFAPQVGSWYNLILTFSSGVVTMYINGQPTILKQAAFTSIIFCPNSNFIVGGWWSRDPQSLNGAIDELRLYNRTLDAAQIAWLARNFQPGSTRLGSAKHSAEAPNLR